MLVFRSTTAAWLIAAGAACVSPAVVAQPANGPAATTLREVFEAAWERQPDARAAAARRLAAEAGRAPHSD